MAPFGAQCEFPDFKACVRKMQGKVDDPEAYCAVLMRRTEEHCKGMTEQSKATIDIGDIGDEPFDSPDFVREVELETLERYHKGLADAPILYRAAGFQKAISEPDGLMIFVASEESEDRMGDVIAVNGWALEEYKKNPVYLYGHMREMPPIGIVPKVWVEGKQLLNTVFWDKEDDFAQLIKGKYERKIMRAQSVGFRALEFQDRPEGAKGINFTKTELMEISAVTVPAHPNALAKALRNHVASFFIQMPRLPMLDDKALSKANRSKLETAVSLIQEVVEGPAPAEPQEAAALEPKDEEFDTATLAAFIRQRTEELNGNGN